VIEPAPGAGSRVPRSESAVASLLHERFAALVSSEALGRDPELDQVALIRPQVELQDPAGQSYPKPRIALAFIGSRERVGTRSTRSVRPTDSGCG
jgi:hypothetical protein